MSHECDEKSRNRPHSKAGRRIGCLLATVFAVLLLLCSGLCRPIRTDRSRTVPFEYNGVRGTATIRNISYHNPVYPGVWGYIGSSTYYTTVTIDGRVIRFEQGAAPQAIWFLGGKVFVVMGSAVFEHQGDGSLKLRDINSIGPLTIDDPWNLPPGPKPWNLVGDRTGDAEDCEEGYRYFWGVLMQEKMEREGYSRREAYDAIYGKAEEGEEGE